MKREKYFFNVKNNCKYKKGLGNAHPAWEEIDYNPDASAN
jgi:hypothetical protein